MGEKIVQCVTCRVGEQDEKGGEGGGKQGQRACKKQRQRQRYEDQAYREVETYGYEEYG